MGIRMGVIADDLTGATDIASELVANGFRTLQLNGIQENLPDLVGIDAIVVGLKSRSTPVENAVAQSLEALTVLQKAGAEQIFFKYCSTFDSTEQGNIGPVTDALLSALERDFTVVCPSFPANGRTVYCGHLFVDGVPLHESGMRNHPLTPMSDSSLKRLMEKQASGRAEVVQVSIVEQGPQVISKQLDLLQRQGVNYAVLDAHNDLHLGALGLALSEMKLLTGSARFAGAIASAVNGGNHKTNREFVLRSGPAVILSGSVSQRTNEQVAVYKTIAPSLAIEMDRLMQAGSEYLAEIVAWFGRQVQGGMAPMIYATSSPESVRATQQKYGAEEVSSEVESLFGRVAQYLMANGVSRFIVAGGETSGAVTSALGISGFEVGPSIAPGVPWVQSIDGQVDLALKSGNFGQADFFRLAQEIGAQVD